MSFFTFSKFRHKFIKGFVAELSPPHAQSAWGFRGERIQAAGLAVCYNYLSSLGMNLSVNIIDTKLNGMTLCMQVECIKHLKAPGIK